MPLAKREQLKGTHHVVVASKTSRAFTSCVSKLQLYDPSLNVGVGAGALYILITCQEEMKRLNKTLEETEDLVQELKEQLQRHHEDWGSHHALHKAEDRSCQIQNSHADMDCNVDGCLEERAHATRGIGKDQMAALAAELEAELELMELNIKTEESLPFETLIHDGEVSSKGVSNSYYSDTSSHGLLEVSDIGRPSAQLEASQMDYGVSAIELDHRLREVLKAQQEERILELEQLLKETKAKLLAKEREVFCWKNHVNSLTDLLQPPSTYGPHAFRLNKPSGAESVTVYDNFVVAVPEVTKSAVELLHSFQDPPLSPQVNYVDPTSSFPSLADVYKRETSPHSSAHGLCSEEYLLKRAPMSASGGESKCWLDYQGTGIDTPEYGIMKDIDTHTVAQNFVFRSDVGSSLVNVDGGDAPSGPELSRPHHWECELDDDRGYVYEDDTPSSRPGLEISRFHNMNETTASSPNLLRSKEELDRDSDVKHVVNYVMPKPILLDKYYEVSGEEAMQAPQRTLKSKNKSLQLITKGLMKDARDTSAEVTTPVLDKIRHYEALGGRAHEKRI